MNLIVFEDAGYRNLLPLVYSRATFNLRCGFDNLLSKIEAAMHRTADAVFVRPALAAVMAERQTRRVNQPSTADDQLWVNGRLLVRDAIDLPPRTAAWRGEVLLAARVDRATGAALTPEVLLDTAKLKQALAQHTPHHLAESSGVLIDYAWQLVHENSTEIVRQCSGHAMSRHGTVDPRAHLISESAVHIGAGARVKAGAVLDAEGGPIYLGDNAVIHPGAVIQGPCYIGEGCTIQPQASVRAGCSIGMMCKVGGEIEGTIFHGYSNKQHDGFLGHSYVGEWVNLGADTVGSDLKNTYGSVSVPINGRPVDSGQMFVGAFIGDHTKTAIGTKLPTGCVIGYACNVVCSGFTPRFVPSFTWLMDAGPQPNDAQKAISVARTVVQRRGRRYSPAEEALFLSIAHEATRHEQP